jgi:hypothetical protein
MNRGFQESRAPAPIPAVANFTGIEFVPQAILRVPVSTLAARLGRPVIHAQDDLDEFDGVNFFSETIQSPVAMRHYAGHPDGTVSLYLPRDVTNIGRITDMIGSLVRDFRVAPQDIIWERQDNPDL